MIEKTILNRIFVSQHITEETQPQTPKNSPYMSFSSLNIHTNYSFLDHSVLSRAGGPIVRAFHRTGLEEAQAILKTQQTNLIKLVAQALTQEILDATEEYILGFQEQDSDRFILADMKDSSKGAQWAEILSHDNVIWVDEKGEILEKPLTIIVVKKEEFFVSLAVSQAKAEQKKRNKDAEEATRGTQSGKTETNTVNATPLIAIEKLSFKDLLEQFNKVQVKINLVSLDRFIKQLEEQKTLRFQAFLRHMDQKKREEAELIDKEIQKAENLKRYIRAEYLKKENYKAYESSKI